MTYIPLNINLLKNNLSNKIVGRNILYYDTLTSTMNKARRRSFKKYRGQGKWTPKQSTYFVEFCKKIKMEKVNEYH